MQRRKWCGPPELPVIACTKASFAFFFETFFYQKLAYFFARGSMSRRLVFVKSSLLPAGRTLHSAELCLSVHMLEVHSSPLIPALRIQKTIFYCVCSHQVCPISSLSNFKSLFSLTKGICNWFQVPTFWVMVLITLEKWSR